MNTALRKTYDELACTYEENRGLFDMTEVLDSFQRKLASKNGRMLDLGCGAGEPFSRYFVDRGWDVIGVDFSSKMLELAAKYVPEMKTCLGDMCEIEFDPCRFDAIVAIYSFFHVPAIEQKPLLEKMHGWLRPEGCALFTYATKDYTGAEEFDGLKEFMGKKLYYSHCSPVKLRSTLEDAGFSVETMEYRDIGNETFLWVTVRKTC